MDILKGELEFANRGWRGKYLRRQRTTYNALKANIPVSAASNPQANAVNQVKRDSGHMRLRMYSSIPGLIVVHERFGLQLLKEDVDVALAHEVAKT